MPVHPEVFVDHVRDLSASEESVFLWSLLLHQVDLLLEVRVLDNVLRRWRDPRINDLKVWVDPS